MQFRCLLSIVFAAGLLSSGCAIPHSEHPLSDEATSKFDERLIGYWNFVPKEEGDAKQPSPFIVGRFTGKPNVMQLTSIELDGEGYAKVKQTKFFTTQIGDDHYLSIDMQEADAKTPAFLIFRYEIKDDQAKMCLPKSDLLVAAIEGGKLKGVLKRQARREGADPNEPTRFDEIRITAPPKELAAFFKEQGKAAFNLDEHLEFERVKME